LKAVGVKEAGLAVVAAAAASLALAASAQAQSDVVATPFGGSFTDPVYVTGAPGQPNLVYVIEQRGVVKVVERGSQLSEPFLDISGIVTSPGEQSGVPGSEQGLLSIAFPPNFADSGLVYAYFTNEDCDSQSGGCDIEVAEFRIRNGNPLVARPASRRTVITIPHRDATNHNGGTLAFGPDRRLWLATGDGGGGNDTFDNARNTESLLGKLLRINPKPTGGPNPSPYRVPRSNPFVGEPGRDEIWSIGLRNPFRFSFDENLVAIGDVGQGAREEVNIVTLATAKGADFQWPAREGMIAGPHPDRATSLPQVPPIHDYPRPVSPPDSTFRGVSVIGGVFARDPRLAGTSFASENDRYFFGEAFVQPTARSFIPNIGAQTIADLRSHPFNIGSVAGIGEDDRGRIYIASLNDTIHRVDPAVAPRRGAPPIGDGEGAVDLVEVESGLDDLVNSAFAPGETDKVYAVEQDGTVKVIQGGTTQTFLDITDLVPADAGEEGLLGVAFHPDYQSNSLVYAYYNDNAGNIVVSEFKANNPMNADESSRRRVIRIPHPGAGNHNGGQLLFGPDGFMYLAPGDGGGGGDPDENAQNKDKLLGKLLRINPLQSGSDAYTVPNSNPFVGRNGRDEIYALGLRNPFRFNFDQETRRIMIGDVGQSSFEEISIEAPSTLRGANFGWDRYEGFSRYTQDPTASTPKPANHDEPVLVYGRGQGQSVIGGLVVRDPDLTNLYGRYLFTDFFANRLRSFVPKLTRVRGFKQIAPAVSLITSFTEDPVTREVYITSRGDGALYRLEPAN
jgi:glucose/arabinose dehydrogenase